jgi:hypothetical protein
MRELEADGLVGGGTAELFGEEADRGEDEAEQEHEAAYRPADRAAEAEGQRGSEGERGETSERQLQPASLGVGEGLGGSRAAVRARGELGQARDGGVVPTVTV